MPNPAEVAIISVNGRDFYDWTSVMVVHRLADGWAEFKFTSAEGSPMPDTWQLLQFKPGDQCTIWLAGQLALSGYIITRQVAYDAKNHAVQLIGKSLTWPAATSSVETATGNFDGKTFEQVAREVLAPFPCGVKVIGNLDATPFDKLQCEKGELVWDFLERLARVRGIIMGSDHLGNFLLIGPHTGTVVQQLVEGDNILKAQVILSNEGLYQKYKVQGQTSGSDQQNGPAASEQSASVPGTLNQYRLRLIAAEQPVKGMSEIQARAAYERLWGQGTFLEAYFTVQGWVRDGVNLWRAGDDVYVQSPMAMLAQVLKIQTITFQQDRKNGTTTTLHCRLPEALVDNRSRFAVTPKPPTDEPRSDSGPSASPPADKSKPPSGEWREEDYTPPNVQGR